MNRLPGLLTARRMAFLMACLMAGMVAGCADDGAGGDASAASDGPNSFVTREVVSIGELEGAEPYLFGAVSDAHRLSDGRIVVGDCQVGELRFFDEAGVHLRTVGGQGQGPGEFVWLSRLFPIRGDSIAVYDQLAGRISVFTGEGDFVRSINAGGAMRGYLVKGALGDRRFVAVATDRSLEAEVGTIFRSPETVVVLDANGQLVDSLGPFPGSESGEVERGTRAVRLGRRSAVSASPAGLAYSVQDAAGAIRFDPTLRDSIRVGPPTIPGPTTEEHRQRWQQAYDDRQMAPEGGIFAAYSDLYADSLPTQGDMYLDRDGGLWLQDPELPWDYPLTYTRYVDDRATLTVELPPRFFPFELHPDGILGVSFAENNVQRIVLLELIPGEHAAVEGTARNYAPTSIPRCGYWVSR